MISCHFENNLQGAVESVSIGEIRLSIRQSLVKLGVGFLSRDPKLQVLICDLEVVMRASSKISKKAKSRKSRKSGRGKWMVVANMARFLSVSVTELAVKVTIVLIKLGLMSGHDWLNFLASTLLMNPERLLAIVVSSSLYYIL